MTREKESAESFDYIVCGYTKFLAQQHRTR